MSKQLKKWISACKPTITAAAATLLLSYAAHAGAVVSFSLTNQGTLVANDDDSTGAVDLGIGGVGGINFFGTTSTSVYVNNNGNVTFLGPLSTYTPDSLTSFIGLPIIAPFFADVDTTGSGSGLATYGNAIYNGYNAFVVNWPGVGYYDAHSDLLNTFQLILTDRSDTGAGNFDIEFNYDQVQWETGDASGGAGGLGGFSAVVGYTDGGSVSYQLPGSLVNGALLDGGPNALISNSLNSDVAGRYDFEVRNGYVLDGPVPEPATAALLGAALLGLAGLRKSLARSR